MNTTPFHPDLRNSIIPGCWTAFAAALLALGVAAILSLTSVRGRQVQFHSTDTVADMALASIAESTDPENTPPFVHVATGTLVAVLFGLFWVLRKRYQMKLHVAEACALRKANASLEESVRTRTSELEAANQRAQHAARVAGMAEVANGVLHNVGNVLNSLATSCHLLGERLARPILNDLPALAQLLEEHQADLAGFLSDDSRGREVLPFVRQLARCWQQEQQKLAEEVDSVRYMVRHVQEIISNQQSLTGVSGMVSPLRIGTLLKEALYMQAARIQDSGIIIERQGESVGEVLVDRVKTVQIVVNLIGNAIDALQSREPGQRHIRLLTEAGPRPGFFSIHVQDDGVGISLEQIQRIFEYGYTTKVGGHGFGLHASALAAQEMGGWLSATSNGPGQGARMTLELPYHNHHATT